MTSSRFSPARTRTTASLFAVAALAIAATVARADEPSGDGPPLQEPGVSESVWQSVHGFFTWKHGQGGVYPIMEIDVGRKNSVGAALFAREAFHPDNQIRLSVAAAFDGLLEVHGIDRLGGFSGGAGSMYLRGLYRQRPDGLFYGLGNQTRSEDKTFFFVNQPEVAGGLTHQLGAVGTVEAELGYRHLDFDSSDYSSDTPSLDQRYGGSGQAALPAGHAGYGLLEGRAALILDSRRARLVGSGVRLVADAAYGADPGASATSFFTWGGTLAAMVDFSGRGHALGLTAMGRFVEDLGDDPIPFTELVSLGGRSSMRAFLPGRLRGESAFVGTLSYQQPLGRLVEGELFLEGGNVFEGRLSGLDPKHLFASYGLRLASTFSREVTVGLLAGFGSTRMDAPDFKPADEFRFNLGVSHSF
jgi:hypothetical protein